MSNYVVQNDYEKNQMFSTLISCLALLCGDILTFVVVHSAALLTVGRLEEK